MTERLSGKVAAITGGAQGNGRAFAQAFVAEGAQVAVIDVDGIAAQRTAAELGVGAVGFQGDVASSADAARMVDDTVAHFGRLDVFVNNAGVIGRMDFLDITDAEWDRVMNINLKGTFLCGQSAARQMVAQGSGSIINVTSVSADSLLNPTTIHYCTSKGGVRTLTKGMALALAPHGVRVNAIGPGPVYTAMSRNLDDPQMLAATLAHIPLGRVAQPDDLKGAAVFLASDESAYVTGITLFVDGGWLTM